MCVAVPMKITQIDKAAGTAKAECSGVSIEVDITLLSPEVGDYVLVHAGCAVEIIKQEAAEEINELFSLLRELAGDEN